MMLFMYKYGSHANIILYCAFQKAMFLYKKQKEEFHSTNMEKISSPITNGPELVSPSDQEKGGLDADSGGGSC